MPAQSCRRGGTRRPGADGIANSHGRRWPLAPPRQTRRVLVPPAQRGATDEREGAKLKALGTQAGAPDLMLVADPRTYGLELKTATGRVSKAQREMLALLTEDSAWQKGLIAHLRNNWDCTKSQCFGHGYTFNTGTVGQILATFENGEVVSKLAYPTNDVSFPWEMVADYAAKSCCSACDNPELSIQGRTHGLLSCIKRPASCKLPWSHDAMVQLQDQGFVTYAPSRHWRRP